MPGRSTEVTSFTMKPLLKAQGFGARSPEELLRAIQRGHRARPSIRSSLPNPGIALASWPSVRFDQERFGDLNSEGQTPKADVAQFPCVAVGFCARQGLGE